MQKGELSKEEIYALIDASMEKQKEVKKTDYMASGEYDGNTMPDKLLEDSFKQKDDYQYHLSIIKQLSLVLKDEFHLEEKLYDVIQEALKSKYGKHYAALNQALPMMKKLFNISLCDVVMAVGELIYYDTEVNKKGEIEYRVKWIDISNTKIIKMEMEERFYSKQDEMM